MVDLDGGGGVVDIAPGYRLAAPGLVGTATARPPRQLDGSDRGPELATSAFDEAIRTSGVRELMNIDLTVNEVPPPPEAPQVRTMDGEDGLVLETPDLGPDVGQVVLAVDEGGVVTWNFPESSEHAIEPPSVRGAGGSKRFVIRRSTTSSPQSEDSTRGLFGLIGRKVLKVLIYPVTDAILGPISDRFAKKWEEQNRPYGARLFLPKTFRNPRADQMSTREWQEVSRGPGLLFLHGTFSTSHGGFGALQDDTLRELNRRYGGRVFAFDHHTLSDTPEENVAKFASLVPEDVKLEVDIVSHSRGGLVARVLAKEIGDVGIPRMSVNRVVFVATPNHGTALADADRMVEFIDRYTSVLNLVPPGPLSVVSEILEAVITAVKMVGHAALRGLGGLTAMDPRGDFISRINAGQATASTYYGMSSNYEPSGPLASMITKKIADSVVDRVFGDQGNDLVVPTLGVSEGSDDPAFPLSSDRLLRYDHSNTVQHTNFFSQSETNEKLLEWLVP